MRRYSDKYLNNYDILSKATIGFELEAFFNTSYYKTLENLNALLSPIKVHGFRTYHSKFTVDDKNFKLERDLSGGQNLAEIVTGPQEYFIAKNTLIKLLKFIQENATTNNKCSLHINISFPDIGFDDLNILKLILSTDEDLIYQKFPTRKNNIYAKSVHNIVPYRDYDFSSVDISTIKNNIRVPNDKYYGINFLNIDKLNASRIEYRYIGGEDYQFQMGDILELLDMFIIDAYNSIKTPFTNDEIEKLSDFLNDKLSNFKNLSSYNNFLVEYPNIELQINQESNYPVVSSYYPKIFNALFNFLEAVDEIDEATINYYSATAKLEIVNATFKSTIDLSNYDFIACEIHGGIFSNSNFVNCDILNSEITKSKLINSDAKKTKLISVNADNSFLVDCFFQAGYMNSKMVGGILRSGRLGELADISDTTKVIGKEEKSFFDTTIEEEDTDKKKI